MGSLDGILAIFRQYNIPATLFVTGKILKENADLIRDLAKDYEISCHSYSHRFWNKLSEEERNSDLDQFIILYQSIFGKRPIGFRSPSHIIDEAALKALEEKGFLYDSSVVPRYPFLKKYRGYKGKAPVFPYRPSYNNYRKAGEMSILEIPAAGQLFGIPLAGAWIAKLPFLTYKFMFQISKPRFISLSIHSWDPLNNLDKILGLLKGSGYQFLNGEQIFKNYK